LNGAHIICLLHVTPTAAIRWALLAFAVHRLRPGGRYDQQTYLSFMCGAVLGVICLRRPNSAKARNQYTGRNEARGQPDGTKSVAVEGRGEIKNEEIQEASQGEFDDEGFDREGLYGQHCGIQEVRDRGRAVALARESVMLASSSQPRLQLTCARRQNRRDASRAVDFDL